MSKWPVLALILALSGCLFDDEPEVIRLSGQTMGTTFSIVAIGNELESESLAKAVEDSLTQVNAQMSNWDPNSEVSKFSALQSTEPMQVSAEFAKVMVAANEVHAQSKGKFDVTLGPLIELWGFGPRKPEDPIPTNQEIADALVGVGQSRLLKLETGKLTKLKPETGLNLSAIAKGYGVDVVAQAISDLGAESYLVEIGGDLLTEGVNDKGEPWKIGIEKPQSGSQAIQLVVPISGYGMATSGDYRNYFEHNGVRYSHILDPVAGRPVTHNTTSVTVVADSAMKADAWATAMLVLGLDEGLRVAEEHSLAVFFVERDVQGGEDAYMTAQSSAFSKLLTEN